MATLTYIYARSVAVVSPLSPADGPHSWDLCEGHAARITAPRNWELIREDGVLDGAASSAVPAAVPAPHRANAEARPQGGYPADRFGGSGPELVDAGVAVGARRQHLRALPDPAEESRP